MLFRIGAKKTTDSFVTVWGHPHDGTPSSIQLSRSVHLCLLARNTALFRAPTSESHYTGHACQICQLTNGRAGWPAEIRIKEGSPGCEHSFNAPIKYRAHQDNKKEETTPDCPATMPRGPGTSSSGRTPRLTPQPRCRMDLTPHITAQHAT